MTPRTWSDYVFLLGRLAEEQGFTLNWDVSTDTFTLRKPGALHTGYLEDIFIHVGVLVA